MRFYVYFSRIISLLIDIFTVVYFVALTGLLPSFAIYFVIGGCALAFLNWCFAENAWDRYKSKHEVKENKVEKAIDVACSVPVYAVMSPTIIMSLLESHGKYDMKKRFKFLLKRGYSYEEIEHVSYFRKGETIVKIFQDYEYKISYDGGNAYVNVYDTELGTQYERDVLKKAMADYASASIEAKREGSTVDTAYYFAKFIKENVR